MKNNQAVRRTVVIIGEINSGKSTLFNALTGQNNAIVSEKAGTTTDPVKKAMELIPYGPIMLTDTAGFSDGSEIGELRMQKTKKALRNADALIYIMNAAEPAHEAYKEFSGGKTPCLLVISKCGSVDIHVLEDLKKRYAGAYEFCGNDPDSANGIRVALSKLLTDSVPKERPLLEGLVKPGSTVLLVTPIDSAAPAGRLILPQVQVIRACLDAGTFCALTLPENLEDSLTKLKNLDLVITDSQAFSAVASMVPEHIPLTSFSILLARQKGDFVRMLEAAQVINALDDNACILVLEGCTHNRTHEDIGRVKIPDMLRRKTGKNFNFEFKSGSDFPESLEKYSLAVQCGGCMLSSAELSNRMALLEESGVPLTNYGMLLAWGSGALNRCKALFD